MGRVGVVLMATMLASCGASEPTPLASEATPPERPQIPPGWVTVTSMARDVELTVPPDLVIVGPDAPVGIFLQAAMVGGVTPLQVWAHGPSDLPDQPASGESLRSWLERTAWFPVEGGATTLGVVSERVVLLPAGRALELAGTAQPGTPEESRVVAYAIETEAGFGVLQIVGPPDVLEGRGELRLIPMLLRFNE